MSSHPILQVALDFERLSAAKKVAKFLSKELNDVEYFCEAGTPLIKNEGLKTVIPRLRNIVGKKTQIIADLKTLDTGAFEVELAYKAGANIVGVAGAAEVETIEAALAKGLDIQMPVMIDSISTRNMKGHLDWIIQKISRYNEEGGCAILEYHIPIDRQAKTRDFTQVKRIYDQFGIPIAVAGGLDENTIPEVLGYGAKICVVGGAITRPKYGTSKEAIRKVKEIIYRL